MPNTRREDLPGTLERSPAKAQRTYAETLDAAHDTYDSEERAHRTAYAALKHSFEKVGDHWEPKSERGPSDPGSARPGRSREAGREQAGRSRQAGRGGQAERRAEDVRRRHDPRLQDLRSRPGL